MVAQVEHVSARDEILARVRAAVSGISPSGTVPAAPRIDPPADLVAHFVARVRDYGAAVERCREPELVNRVMAAVADQAVVVPAELSITVPGAVVDAGLSPAELEGFHAVVTDSRVAIAETGTIILDHVAGQGRRALTLLPDRHVCIVRADQIVSDVPDALPLLQPARPHTWMSGPSATSDIELQRVEGVHGPRSVHVLVVDPWQPRSSRLGVEVDASAGRG
jgi:L-lactate utilization protein LutC